ncbi:Proteasome subunit beta type-7 [Boothiomyces sp. JEL0866]|nr:Proteasome subunit beta type-7 [Boothiomyces sp. JEL0866]
MNSDGFAQLFVERHASKHKTSASKVAATTKPQLDVNSDGSINAGQIFSTLTGTIAIGNPPQLMNVLFDTGSDLFWLRGKSCNTDECVGKATYDSSKSTSFSAASAKSTSISYGDGTKVQCVIGQDTVTIGKTAIPNQNICIANSIVSPLDSTDGIIGLASFGAKGSSGADLLFSFSQQQGASPIIGFWYDLENTNSTNIAGEISFGHVDNAKINGSMAFLPVDKRDQAWFARLNSIVFNGNSINSTVTPVLIDSGTTDVSLPDAAFQTINENMRADQNGNVDCSIVPKLPLVEFGFGDVKMVLTGNQQVTFNSDNTCTSIFSSAGDQTPIFGALLLRQYYVSFDYRNSAIGISQRSNNYNSNQTLPASTETPYVTTSTDSSMPTETGIYSITAQSTPVSTKVPSSALIASFKMTSTLFHVLHNDKTQVKAAFQTYPQLSVTPSGSINAGQLFYTLTGTIQVGTPPTLMNVLFDTGSDLFWVRGANCNSTECVNQVTFDPTKSSSFSAGSNKATSIQYGDGTSIQCTIGQDTVAIGTQVLANQNICVADNIVSPLASTDGIVGLASLGDQGSSGADVFASLLASNSNIKPQAGFWFQLDPNLQSNQTAGEITFGGFDPTRKIGDFEFLQVDRSQNTWLSNLNSIRYQGRTLFKKRTQVLFDTGTTDVSLPAKVFNIVNAKMNADQNGNVDCSQVQNLPPIQFKFGKMKAVFTGEQQVQVNADGTCTTIFSAADDSFPPIFGAQFLRQFYTVFDYGESKIGFAKRADGVTTETQIQTSTDQSQQMDHHPANWGQPLKQYQPIQHTQQPIVTGTSVLGIVYKDGVMLAADTLASYGSLAQIRDMKRLAGFGDYTVIGAGGDMSDWQHIQHVIEGEIFLGYVDYQGTTYHSSTIATGYGSYIAQPLLRKAVEGKEDTLTEQEAIKILDDCMRVLFYRDARSLNKIQRATINGQGWAISEPYSLQTEWGFADSIRGYGAVYE